jgi:hypothetical protein
MTYAFGTASLNKQSYAALIGRFISDAVEILSVTKPK